MGIRVIDLFRMFDQDYHGQVTKDNFVRGIKKIGAPLSDVDLKAVAKRLDRKGHISYSVLANGVRNHLREERKEDKKFELLERKRREERKRILKTGVADFRAPMITEISYFRTSATKNFEKLLSSPSASSLGLERYGFERKRSVGQFLPELQNDGNTTSRSAVSMSLSSYRRPASKLSLGNLSTYSEYSGSVATTNS
ncbi:hypothetical protein KUTeg_013325 [Tegillarca granosa]|uniref:EF-hand domain-containing protein n=1 Tax=Tegillarca granosa TaxID=220873 RepID=A0ABQ9ETD0_TEGGR|nr:hypothetical protein KUTeg_013325 [Tegillarca granosa]